MGDVDLQIVLCVATDEECRRGARALLIGRKVLVVLGLPEVLESMWEEAERRLSAEELDAYVNTPMFQAEVERIWDSPTCERPTSAGRQLSLCVTAVNYRNQRK